MQTIANQDQIDALKMNTSLLVISYTFLVLVRPLVRPPFPLGMVLEIFPSDFGPC